MIRFVLPMVLFGATAGAQDIRESDNALSREALSDALSGKVVTFFDGSSAEFSADGGYRYIYQPGDPPFVGTFETEEESRVCVTFDNGFNRCDAYVRDGDRLVLITADGVRFPVKSVQAVE